MRNSIDQSKLIEWEELGCSGITLQHQIISQLICDVRSLQHELDEPNYQYVGRIHRQGIISRNQRIDQLEKEIKQLNNCIKQLQDENLTLKGTIK